MDARVARCHSAARIAAVIAISGGVLVVFAWIFGLDALKRPLAGVATMKANTAVALVLSGVCVWLSTQPGLGSRRLLQVAAWLVALLALVTASQDLVGWQLGIDELLFRDETGGPGAPGRMAPATAFCFLAFGVAAAASANPRRVWLAHAFALIVGLTAIVALVGYLYDVQALYGIGLYATMAVHTAFLLLVLAVGLLCARPTGGLMDVLLSESYGGVIARRVLPPAIVFPVLIGWLRLRGELAGYFGERFGVALMVVSTIVIVATLIWWSASSLRRMESERRATEAAVHGHLRDVLDTALDAVVSIDAEGQVTFWNRRAEAIFGWSAQEAHGREIAALVMPARYRDAHREGLRRFLATGEGPILNQRIALTASHRDGTEFPIELAVTAVKESGTYSFNAFIADVTERRAAEKALQMSEQQKASLLRLSGHLERAHTFSEVLQAALAEVRTVTGYRSAWAYLFSEDGASMSLLSIEGARADTLRRSAPVLTVKGDGMLEALLAAHGPVVVEDARTDPRTNKELVARFENRTIINVPMMLADKKIGAFGTGSFGVEGVRLPDRHELDYLSTMAGQLGGVFDRIQLLEERAQAYEDIRTLNAQLEQRVLERTAQLEAANEELEAFTYSVSHDLRAPLRHIDGFARILLEEYAGRLDADGRHYLDVICGGARSMGEMVDDLLQLSQIEHQDLVRKPTDLNVVVRDVIAELEPACRGRDIEWVIGELPVAPCDPGLIKLVFVNLLSNAVKYTRRRTPAVIEVGRGPHEHPAVIFIKDNGAGFDERHAHKLFGVFQRLHRKEDFEGTGIGLATVQRILKKHGGRVWAEAAVDAGATFFLTLGETES